MTPLFDAAFNGHADAVKALIAAGADMETKCDDRETTPLIDAACDGHIKVVEVLLLAGANKDAKNKYDDTAIDSAAWKGHTDIVRVLVIAGADVNSKPFSNFAPLHCAVRVNDVDLVKLLLEAGASKDAENRSGETALMLAINTGNKTIVELLSEPDTDKLIQSGQENSLERGIDFKSYLKQLFSEIINDGQAIYLQDQSEAFEWYRQKGFNEYDNTSFDSLSHLLEKIRISQENCDWVAAIAGAHKILDGMAIFQKNGNLPFEYLLKYISAQEQLTTLGTSHTALADYEKAELFLEAADKDMKNNDPDNEEVFVSLFLEKAVFASASKKDTSYQKATEKLLNTIRAAKDPALDEAKWALFSFQRGMKNQKIWDEDKKFIPSYQAHAIGYYMVSAELNKELQDYESLAMTYANMGIAFMTLNDKENAEECWSESMQYVKKAKDNALIDHITTLISEARRDIE
jgi:hypothetical protein